MTTKKQNIAAVEKIRSILKKLPEQTFSFIQDTIDKCAPGQIWETVSKNMEFPFVLILEKFVNDKSYNVVPVFRWQEKAGPEDLFIPRTFTGTPMIASFELEFPVSVNFLKDCKGSLAKKELKYILEARNALKPGNSTMRSKFTWGWSYLDKYDVRLQYHKALDREIKKNKINLVLIKVIPFPVEHFGQNERFEIAAASNKLPCAISFSLKEYPDVNIEIRENKDRQFTIRVIDKERMPSNALDDLIICDGNCRAIKEIKNGKAVVAKDLLKNGIKICKKLEAGHD